MRELTPLEITPDSSRCAEEILINTKMNQKQTIYTTIAYRNPREAYNFLAENGYNKMKKDPQVIAVALADFANKNQELALPKLAAIHPDKELFKTEVKQETAPIVPPLQPIISNCDGCEYKNVDAPKPAVTPKETGKKFSLSENTINILIVSGAGVFVLTAITVLILQSRKS